MAILYCELGAYMFTFDLKSGYHHIEVATDHQCYLGFSWVDPVSKRPQFYRFTVLPFRLSSAPHIFTKVLKPLEKNWRLNGARIALFLDAGLGIASTRDACASLGKTVKDDLLSAGFVSHDDKSVWKPCQSILWLGIIWHSDSGAIEISERRVAKIVSTVCSTVDCEFLISARSLASFTGQIFSTGPVVGNVSRIMTRHCSMSFACALLGCPFRTGKLFSGRKILILLSPGFVFWTESFACLAFLIPVQLVVAQLSLLTRNTFVISFGIPARPPKVRLGGNSLP